MQDDPFMNNVHGSEISSLSSVVVIRESSFRRSAMKSAKIYPFTDVLGLTLQGVANKVDWLCFASFSVINTALTASRGAVSVGSSAISFFICLNAASAFVVHWKLLFFMHFFKALKNDSDFFADLDRNLFRLANFPLRFCTSFRHFGDGMLKMASTLSGHTFIPLVFTLYP
ncbi:hypothetical protein Tco_0872088 [Tanacetum coccineum]